ncbi:hypothetical protein [Xanthocytophaga flava]|uniref:hypothetical protein n=1 Tax=Xanthocytophaga flava TaxID=3048013 RepID=UPI0028D32777|nr:hypothetical protein [Xanthocytophaga flavus]MDJ1468165.1 hypothetical protein [Xanthocytophaga flavus]
MKNLKQLTVILEKADNGFWARIETIRDYGPNGHGETIEELEQDLRNSLTDYLENEGKDNPDFAGLTANDIEFIYEYDLQAFFEKHSYLKITDIAKIAGINGSSLRQYATGLRQASDKHVKLIEEAIHKIGKELMEAHLV